MIPVLSISYGFMGLMTSSSWWEVQATCSLGDLWLNIWSLHSTVANQKLFQKDNYLHRKAQICFKSRDLLARSSILHPCLLGRHCPWICWITRPRWWSSRLWSCNCCRAFSCSGLSSELAALWGIPCAELGAYTSEVYVTSNFNFFQIFLKNHTLSIVPLFSWQMVQDVATYLSPFFRLQNPQKSHRGVGPLNFCGFMSHSCLHNFFCTGGSDFHFLLLRHNQHHIM